MKTIMRLEPIHTELERMSQVFDHLMNQPWATQAQGSLIPMDVFEKDNVLKVRAALPGISPEDIDVSIEGNVLTIKGETKASSEFEEAKVYRREISVGSFTRSLRLPQNLKLDEVAAEFEHGFVVISIPRIEPEKPKAIRVPVRPMLESRTEAIEATTTDENQ